MQTQPYVFSINDNDGLPLEYKLKEGRPGRYLNIKDVINNTEAFRLRSADEGGFEEQLLRLDPTDFRVTYNDVGD